MIFIFMQKNPKNKMLMHFLFIEQAKGTNNKLY